MLGLDGRKLDDVSELGSKLEVEVALKLDDGRAVDASDRELELDKVTLDIGNGKLRLGGCEPGLDMSGVYDAAAGLDEIKPSEAVSALLVVSPEEPLLLSPGPTVPTASADDDIIAPPDPKSGCIRLEIVALFEVTTLSCGDGASTLDEASFEAVLLVEIPALELKDFEVNTGL
ncbi:hypothetical protein M409DRAFT_16294 [Zasmidium cellare ATCC 36951]|uniref:Uncharacterized protein n=1 Tax=Zasmidium cellare ATCC 36951 TaxID=1080233 RepID=A0A6A6D3N2_ZASCE|nr:uncharacterized protein M409DRAFT_16294 [Zasmidium cellare ATCC 36951]KAF2174021.1 hypothetical protein M409DRAFT_16294 [Zasmidium cellare ATCC 36951]